MIILKEKNWEVKIQISTKGILYTYLYYKDKPLGFVNLGTREVQNLFYLDFCPDLVYKAEQIRKDYFKKKGEIK